MLWTSPALRGAAGATAQQQAPRPFTVYMEIKMLLINVAVVKRGRRFLSTCSKQAPVPRAFREATLQGQTLPGEEQTRAQLCNCRRGSGPLHTLFPLPGTRSPRAHPAPPSPPGASQ